MKKYRFGIRFTKYSHGKLKTKLFKDEFEQFNNLRNSMLEFTYHRVRYIDLLLLKMTLHEIGPYSAKVRHIFIYI